MDQRKKNYVLNLCSSKYLVGLDEGIFISSMASKPINIPWIRNGSQPYWKIMYSIVLYPVFYEYKKEQS